MGVTVVSTIKSNPPTASDEIRRATDNFLDLTDLMALFGRPPRERTHAEDRYGDEEDQ
jgi:hypothetical protein